MTGYIFAQIGFTLIYIVYAYMYIKAFVLYSKNYKEINKRYWGKNKGKPDEAMAGGFVVLVLASLMLYIVLFTTPTWMMKNQAKEIIEVVTIWSAK